MSLEKIALEYYPEGSGEKKPYKFGLNETIAIGRNPSADITIPNGVVEQPIRCFIYYKKEEGLKLHELASSIATKIEREGRKKVCWRGKEVDLMEGDKIIFPDDSYLLVRSVK